MAQAAAEEFKDAAPAMYGMALLGIVPQVPARRIIERVKTGGDERNAPALGKRGGAFGGDAAEAGPREAGADVLGSPKAGEPRQGRLQFGEAGGRPQLGYIIYGADGNPVGTSREPAILPTSGGIYYDSYASAFADAGRRGGGAASVLRRAESLCDTACGI